jgi:thiamine pyrophosphate-dependent acetolactate synthase large subunit-like protein
MNLGEALLEALRDRGATEVFGIPGDFVLGFFRVMEESGILPHYTLSHEPAVGFAADVAGRANGALGGEGERAHTRRELADALERAATTRGRFYLVEAMLEPGRVSETLARYVAAAKRGGGRSAGR